MASDIIKRELDIIVAPASIPSAFRMRRKPNAKTSDMQSIMITLSKKDTRTDLIRAAKTVKPPDFFINENLTPVRSKILFGLRRIKRKFPEKVASCGSMNGNVYIWMRSQGSAGKNFKLTINTQLKFSEICEKSFGITSEEIFTTTRK